MPDQSNPYERNFEVRKHYQSPWTAVMIPLLQALVSGIFATVLASGAYGIYRYYDNIWAWGYFLFGLITGVSWFALLVNWRNVVWRLEEIYGVDIDKDQQVGHPVERFKVEITRRSGNSYSTQYLDDMPLTITHAQMLFPALAKGVSFSENNWVSPKKMSRDQFLDLRNYWLDLGWLVWINPDRPKLGTNFTEIGRSAVKNIAAQMAEPQESLPPDFTPINR